MVQNPPTESIREYLTTQKVDESFHTMITGDIQKHGGILEMSPNGKDLFLKREVKIDYASWDMDPLAGLGSTQKE